MLIYKYSQIPDKNRITYDKSLLWCKNKRQFHLGQLKLFFSELIFLVKYAKPGHKILYIGAAPGYHINKLADLFPDLFFDLWDPREFEIAPRANIKLYKEFFTDTSANAYAASEDKILLMCDLRTMRIALHKRNKDIEKMDELVDEDMKMQSRWCQIIKPEHAYLKFRLPYEIPKIRYLSGTIFLQPYTKISTEARLLTNDYDTKIIYDTKEFEEKLAWHNAKRCNSDHYNKWKSIIEKYNLYNCWDNAMGLHIVHFYLKHIKQDSSEDKVGTLFMEIIKFHSDKYGKRYGVIFADNKLPPAENSISI